MAMDNIDILWNKISKIFNDKKFEQHLFYSRFTAIKGLMNDENNKKALCSLYYLHKLNNKFVDALCKLFSSETPSEASSTDDDKLAKLSTFANDLDALSSFIESGTLRERSSTVKCEKLRKFVEALRGLITSGNSSEESSTVLEPAEVSEIAEALFRLISSEIPSEASSTDDDQLPQNLRKLIASTTPLEARYIVDKIEKSSKFAETRDSLYDLEEVLEESQKFERKRKKLQKKLLLVNPVSKLYFYVRNKKGLKSIKDNLSRLSSQKETIFLHFPTKRYTYLSINTIVIGFDEHLKRIEDKLLNGSFRTFGIFGMAGAGKTTLARMVFSSNAISFDKRIWLCLSDSSTEKKEDLNMKIVKCILEELDYDSDSLAIDISLNDLLGELYKRLENKKYLIVLDDVGPNLIKHCLSKGMPKGGGGVVVVTSRSQEVVKHMVGEVEDNLLDFSSSLDNEICWELFRDDMLDLQKGELLSHISSEHEEEIKYQCRHLPSAAKALARIFPDNKDFMKEKDSILKDFYIGDDLFGQGSESQSKIPKYPVLVFLNTKSGGNHMKKLFEIICRHLNKKQVFDSADPKKELLGFLDSANSEVKKELQVIVVGGDAVANSIRDVVADMKLTYPLLIASVPYKEELKAGESVKLFMKQIQDAEYMRTDRWHISIRIKDSMDSIAHEDMLRALYMFHQEVNDEKQIKDKYAALQGEFSKCFMIGLGTSVCSGVGCFSSSTRTISKLGTVKIKKRDEHLRDHSMSSSVRSIYCHNLYRIPGGLNPQENPTDKEKQEVNNLSGVQRPSFIDDKLLKITTSKEFIDDKLLKITTSKEGWPPESRHGMDEIDQVEEICFLLGTAEHLNISIDGELWERIPVDGIESINISRCGQINFLAMPDCEVKSKPVPDSTAIVGHRNADPRSSEIQRKSSARTKSNLNI